MTHATPGRLIAVIAVLLALPRPAIAQGAGISAVALSASHWLLGDPLAGGAAFLEFPRGGGRVTVRLGGELLRGSSRRTGSLCVGLAPPPGGCADEPLRDNAWLGTFAVGLGARVLSRDRFAVKLTGDFRLGVVESDTRGLTSGGRLSADETLWGADVGIEGAWSPWATKPLALVASVSVGGLLPVMPEEVTDGYTPFNTPFHFTRVGVGVAWRPRTR